MRVGRLFISGISYLFFDLFIMLWMSREEMLYVIVLSRRGRGMVVLGNWDNEGGKKSS